MDEAQKNATLFHLILSLLNALHLKNKIYQKMQREKLYNL
jgi:hypothetical protein